MSALPSSFRNRLRPYYRAIRNIASRNVTVHDLAYFRTISMSQFGEDIALLHLFEEDYAGFYVDVGALDPIVGSNTYRLYQQGWSGINIEPIPTALAKISKSRPRDVCLSWAISTEAGPAVFISEGSFSGLDNDSYLWSRSETADRLIVERRTLANVLEEWLPVGTHIDLLCVDCEGHDGDVLLSNDWSRFRPTVVLTERHDGQNAANDPVSMMKALGYRLDRRAGPTYLFIDDEITRGRAWK